LRPKISGPARGALTHRKAARPDCASAVGETAIGAVTSGAAVRAGGVCRSEIAATAGVEATGAALLEGGEMVEAGVALLSDCTQIPEFCCSASFTALKEVLPHFRCKGQAAYGTCPSTHSVT
jgi:hypothetical protein